MAQITVIKRDGTHIPLNSASGVRGVTKAEQQIALLGEDLVNITLSSSTPLEFDLGDYIVVFGKKYTINTAPDIEKKGDRSYQYNLKFEGSQYELSKVQYLDEDETGVNLSGDFYLTGTLKMFMNVLINNIQRIYGNTWQLGTCPETEGRTLSFSNQNCLAVLQQLCQEFETEFSITFDGSRYTINIGSAGNIFPETFSYGQGRGLWSLTRKNVSEKNPISRLFAYGGTRNIQSGYRNYSTRLKLPFSEFIEDPNAVSAYGVIEGMKLFDDIYPHREGTITALGGNVYTFVDSDMDFDLNDYLVGGVSAKVHFNSGNLAGYSFELKSYSHTTKQFMLLPYDDERGMRFPSETSDAFKINVGDKYTLLDIYMPESYVSNAESRLLEKAQEYLSENSSPRVQYELTFDELFLKARVPEGTIRNFFTVGDYIPIKDEALGIDQNVRVQSFVRDIIREYQYRLSLNDNTEIGIIQRLIASDIDTNKIIVENRLNNISRALQGWRTTQELRDMTFDPDGYYYTDKIKANSIETNQLTTGARSTQLETNVILEPNYNANPNVINVRAGILTHLVIEDEPRTWSITATSYVMSSSSTAYYIYAKCIKQGSTGDIIFSTDQIKVDDDPLYYHFLLGILHSVDSNTNVRWVSLTYGTTAINGRFIRTGRIQSADGKTWFDLDTGEISGKITFINSSGQYESIEDAINNIQVGGINLIRNSGQFKNTSYWAQYTAVTSITIQADDYYGSILSCVGTAENARLRNTDIFELLAGETITVTAIYKSDYPSFRIGGKFRSDTGDEVEAGAYECESHEYFDLPNGWKKVIGRYTLSPTSTIRRADIYFFIGAMSFLLAQVKVEKGTISTDWSLSPKDIDANITAAQQAANDAQNSANVANALLADIANDNKLTPEEKQSTKLEWDKIVAEYPKITADAVYYSIDTTALYTAYYALNGYITPLLADLTTTTDIIGTTFRSNFLNYYNVRQDLLNLISQRAKDIGDKKGNNLLYPELLRISVGNLIAANDYNKFAQSLNGAASENLIVSGENPFGEQAKLWKCKSNTSTTQDGGFHTLSFNVNASEAYRFSVFVKRGSEGKASVYLGLPTISGGVVETLDGTSDANPYFFVGNQLEVDKWYLMVGYVFPAGFTEDNHVTLSGLYDAKTGSYVAGTDFRLKASTTQLYMRAYLYYATTNGITQYFYSPMVHKCDGTEPSIATILGIDPYAQGIANAAQQAASNAQQTAQQATDRLDDWASDSYISPTEKTGLLQQKADMESEYVEILNQVSLYLLITSSQWIAYNSAYRVARMALNKYTAATPENIPIEADYSNIAAYYTKRQDILNLVAQTLNKEVTDLDYLKAALKQDTTINGGLISTSVVRLGSSSNGVSWVDRAGLNGLIGSGENEVRIWAGESYANRANAPFKVLQSGTAVFGINAIQFNPDGSGFLAKGNISWDVNGNLVTTGTFKSQNDDNRIEINPGVREIQLWTSGVGGAATKIGYWHFAQYSNDIWSSLRLSRINISTGKEEYVSYAPIGAQFRVSDNSAEADYGLDHFYCKKGAFQVIMDNRFYSNYLYFRLIGLKLTTNIANEEVGLVCVDANGFLKVRSS